MTHIVGNQLCNRLHKIVDFLTFYTYDKSILKFESDYNYGGFIYG